MKLRILALAVLALPALGLAEETAPKSEVVALKAARLFSGKGDSTIRDAVVIVEGGRIKAVGSGLPVPAGARATERVAFVMKRGRIYKQNGSPVP